MLSLWLSAALLLIGCGALLWWLYRRERVVSRQRNQAERQAQELLRRMLQPNELHQLRTHRFLEVGSRLIPGRVYRIPHRRGQVRVYEGGRHTGNLCIEPTRWVPDSDVLLIHKLLLEADEASYLSTANLFKASPQM
ncbi:MAG TPA: hypothetical protein VMV93_04145 [Chloroflexota bacterium]|nr:hypothetical protein [Chloroflexota bacterium]